VHGIPGSRQILALSEQTAAAAVLAEETNPPTMITADMRHTQSLRFIVPSGKKIPTPGVGERPEAGFLSLPAFRGAISSSAGSATSVPHRCIYRVQIYRASPRKIGRL
jgi:hypothetical protein